MAGTTMAMAKAVDWKGEVTGRHVCIELDEKHNKYLHKFCFDSLRVKYRIGVYLQEPYQLFGAAWTPDGMLHIRGRGSVAVADMPPSVQAAYGSIKPYNLLLGATLEKDSLIQGAILFDPGTLEGAGEGFGFDTPASPSWDKTFIRSFTTNTCIHASKPAIQDYMDEQAGKKLMKKGFVLANLQVCQGDVSNTADLNRALRETCEAWLPGSSVRRECEKNKNNKADKKTDKKTAKKRSWFGKKEEDKLELDDSQLASLDKALEGGRDKTQKKPDKQADDVIDKALIEQNPESKKQASGSQKSARVKIQPVKKRVGPGKISFDPSDKIVGLDFNKDGSSFVYGLYGPVKRSYTIVLPFGDRKEKKEHIAHYTGVFVTELDNNSKVVRKWKKQLSTPINLSRIGGNSWWVFEAADKYDNRGCNSGYPTSTILDENGGIVSSWRFSNIMICHSNISIHGKTANNSLVFSNGLSYRFYISPKGFINSFKDDSANDNSEIDWYVPLNDGRNLVVPDQYYRKWQLRVYNSNFSNVRRSILQLPKQYSTKEGYIDKIIQARNGDLVIYGKAQKSSTETRFIATATLQLDGRSHIKDFHEISDARVEEITQAENGDILFTGYKKVNDMVHPVAIKLSPEGNLLWQREYKNLAGKKFGPAVRLSNGSFMIASLSKTTYTFYRISADGKLE